MEIIDGKKVSNTILENIKHKMEKIKLITNKVPTLAVILVGDDIASKIYVSKKENMAKNLGFNSVMINLPENTKDKDLANKINELNNDCNINAILLQLPLPKNLNSDKFIEQISPLKDVDGFTPINAGFLSINRPFVLPCTAYGILKLLNAYNIPIEGKNVVIVGRSNIVGKPLANLLLNNNATVTIAHSKTKNLKDITKTADILISATGSPKLIKKDMVKDMATVIDVGISRDEFGKISGDVDFDTVKEIAKYITPVPGGVGPMTIACLAQNTLELFCMQNNINEEEL